MLVSVIIPTFNRSSFLKECIDAVLKQTHQEIELIVVDDGSTDETPCILSNYQTQIKVITQKNKGVSSARNIGIKNAKGNYIAFCDSDDYWLPKKIEEQLLVFEKYPETMLCYTGEIWIRNGKRVNPKKKHSKESGWILEKCLELCIVSPSSVIMKKIFFEEIGNFDENLPACEDYDLWIRGALKYPYHFTEKQLIIKNGGHEDQLSHKYWGMDRFRIESLIKCLKTEKLTSEQKEMVVKALEEKCRIFVLGACKRGNEENEKKYKEILDWLQEYKEK